MDVHVTDDQIGRYFRRIQLGLRLLAHGARAQTTCDWSGLTPDQLVTLRRRWMFNADDRLRGPSPSSFQIFFRSAKTSSQAALFVCLCRTIGAKAHASLENGERLCDAFEIFREWEPQSEFEFEQAVLLMIGSAYAEKIELSHCTRCCGALLIDKFGSARRSCPRCRRRRSRAVPSANGTLEDTEASTHALAILDAGFSAREQGDQSVVQEQRNAKAKR
jgi:hypothetical protein